MVLLVPYTNIIQEFYFLDFMHTAAEELHVATGNFQGH
jgi:hypothetical protein